MTTTEGLHGLVRAAMGVVPDAVLARVLPVRLRWDPAAMTVAHCTSDALVRLLIAPVNSAGQGYRWARAAEQNLSGVAAVNMMTTNHHTARFAFPADVPVPENGYVFARGWQRKQRAAILNDFTHILLESGRFLYGSVPQHTPLQVVKELGRRGLTVALLWHGSDIRLPSEHARWEKDSPFGENGGYPQESTRILERNARDRRRMITQSNLPVFVSTPGLLDVPRAQWLPVVLAPADWHSEAPPLRRDRPVVAYVPSNSPMKGDSSVDGQLRELEDEGVVQYRRLEGIPSADMPAVYKEADIVLDQFRLGDYGVAACEAMAAGRVVVGHVHDEVRRRVQDVTGFALPIVEARFSQVGQRIREIVRDRDSWREHAARGPAYVRSVHDGRFSANTLAPFLGRPSAGALKNTGVL